VPAVYLANIARQVHSNNLRMEPMGFARPHKWRLVYMKENAMTKWEYQTIILKRELHVRVVGGNSFSWKQSIDLNKLGEDGWELVAVVPISDNQGSIGGLTHELRYILKRPK
jgi:hypothetical protein